MKTCHGCEHILIVKAGPETQYRCKAHPPVPFFVPAAGLSGPMTLSAFPPIDPNVACGEWRRRIEAVGTDDAKEAG